MKELSIRSAIAVALIIFSIGGAFYLFVRPVIVGQKQVVTDKDLEYGGKSMEGDTAYTVIKKELQTWIGMICQLSPVLSIALALYLKRNKKEKKK